MYSNVLNFEIANRVSYITKKLELENVVLCLVRFNMHSYRKIGPILGAGAI